MPTLPPTQIVAEVFAGDIERLILPAADLEVLPGVPWGHAHALFHPAYWAAQLWYTQREDLYGDYRWSRSLREEVIACLLGGHGITFETNAAAFQRLQNRGLLLDPGETPEAVIAALKEPLPVNGRAVCYRFPNQKGRFVHEALLKLAREEAPVTDAQLFRKWLLSFRGIGIKTASWITRNALDSQEVAVIDIHIFRAGVVAGFFSGRERLPKDYGLLETRFLDFSHALGADPRRLDVLMWRQMRDLGDLAIRRYLRAA
jgi:thermostable 8-oxoguanine DNA glycosylase